MPRLEQVFGISSKPLASYVDRKQVDGRFIHALEGESHIIVYGSSKQGKSSLRQKHLTDEKCTIYRCGSASTTQTIYQQILTDAKVRLEVGGTEKAGSKTGGKLTFGYVAWLPFFGGGNASGEASGERAAENTREIQDPVPNLEDAQTICTLLKQVGYQKWVVLENFHYLPAEVQKRLAYDLKTFQEVGFRFIILGIWKEANLLVLHNGDLQDRVVEVPVEPWEESDFDEVITKGEQALNISIPPDIRDELKGNAFGNVGMLQGFLRRYCELHGVEDKRDQKATVADRTHLATVFKEKLAEYRVRLFQAVQGIAAQSPRDAEKPLVLPYYLVRVVLAASVPELQAGISRDDLLSRIKEIHYRKDKDNILMSDLIACLSSLSALQQEMQPPLLHYDINQQRLKLVDTTQFFVLSRLDKASIQGEIPHPLALTEMMN
jgi:hypothetical protein